MTRAAGLYAPMPVATRLGAGGRLESVGDSRVEAVREEWLVEDRWWTYSPLRRHYFELVLESGRCVTIFHDIAAGGWFEQ